MLTSAIGNLALPASAFLLAPVLARSLGVSGRGELASVTATVQLVITIVAFGIPEASTYFLARLAGTPGQLARRSAVLLLATGLVGTAVLLLLAGPLSAGVAGLETLLRVAAFAVIPTLLVTGLRAIAAGQGRWGLVNAEKYLTAGLRLLGVVLLAVTGALTVGSASVILLASPVVAGLVYLRLLSTPVPASTPAERLTYATLGGYGARIWFGAVAGVLLMRLDQVLLGPTAGSVELGLYAAAVNIAEVVLIANHAVRDVTFAAEAARSQDERLQVSARLSTLLAAGLALVIALSVPLWLPVLFGAEFAGAVPVVLVLLLGSVLVIPGSVAGASLSARGDPQWRSASLVVSVVINVSVLLLLAPALGALGAAVATLAANVVFGSLNLVFLRRRHGVRIGPFYGVRRSDVTAVTALVRRLVPIGRGHADR